MFMLSLAISILKKLKNFDDDDDDLDLGRFTKPTQTPRGFARSVPPCGAVARGAD